MRARDESKELAIRRKAIELIVREGLDGFSMGKLAKAAAVSPATLYIYYKDREDLIIQISVQLTTKLLNDSLLGFDPDMDFEEGLRIQWKNRANHFIKYPIETQFVEHIKYTPLHDKVTEIIGDKFKVTMTKFVQNAIKRKQLVSLPFEVYWSVAFAPLYQLIKFHTQGRSHKNDHFVLNDKMMMQTLQLVIKALKP
jgi:AcrR family transcriptional regulator